jgi:hypothetical protein
MPTYQISSTIVKITESDVDGTFDFTSNVPGHASFSLTPFNGAREVTFDNLAAGTYHVTETVPAGWTPSPRPTGYWCRSASAGRAATCRPGRRARIGRRRSTWRRRSTSTTAGSCARAREPPASGDARRAVAAGGRLASAGGTRGVSHSHGRARDIPGDALPSAVPEGERSCPETTWWLASRRRACASRVTVVARLEVMVCWIWGFQARAASRRPRGVPSPSPRRGRVLDVKMAPLDKQSKSISVDQQAKDHVVHLRGCGAAARLADETFDPRPSCQGLALDLLGVSCA